MFSVASPLPSDPCVLFLSTFLYHDRDSVTASMAEVNKISSTHSVSSPMSENQKLFLYEIDEIIAHKFQYPTALSGKWVIFYRKQSMDRIWKEVCKLYRDEELEGVEFLQTSTAKFSKRLKDSDMGMISFICGPSDEKDLVMSYGKNLLKSLHHLTPFDIDTMFYTSYGTNVSSGAAVTYTDSAIIGVMDVPKELRAEECLTLSEPVLTTKNDPIASPTLETEEVYLYEFDHETREKYRYDKSESGKWMLFYENKTIDFMWANACKLYREGELTGVRSMKVSTAKYNHRRSSDTTKVIIFYCGPASNKNLMKSYGKCILEKMYRFGPFDITHMSYKTDAQSNLGTRATGNSFNSIYSLPISEDWRSDNCETSSWISTVATDDLPSQVLDKDWLLERDESKCLKWPCDSSLIGYWLMLFEEAWLDRAWKKARDFYRAGQLTGIQSISVSTAKMVNSRDKGQKVGFINCFCGPVDDIDLVMTYGENLATLMSYCDDRGTMNFKFRKEILCRVKLSNYWQPKKRNSRSTSSGSNAINDVRLWRPRK